MELNSGNLRSWCEAVIVVLQGLMSSKGGTSAGVVTRGVTGSELAEICQQCHMSVTGCNSIPPSRISSQDPEVHGMDSLWGADGVPCTAVGFKIKAETVESPW